MGPKGPFGVGLSGDDIDHAPQGGPPGRGGRSLVDLNPLDVIHGEIREVRHGVGQLVQWHPILIHGHVPGVGTLYPCRGLTPGSPIPFHIYAGDILEYLRSSSTSGTLPNRRPWLYHGCYRSFISYRRTIWPPRETVYY